MRRGLASMAIVGVLALAAAGCGGGEPKSSGETRVVTVTEQAAVNAAPSAQEPTTTTLTEDSGSSVVNRTLGQTGKDGQLTFRVTRVEKVSSIPLEYDDPITPPRNAQLIVVTVTYRNDGRSEADPFCGETGAVLIDEQDRNFEWEDGAISIAGNSICSGVQPGFKSTDKLPFFIPKGARPAAVAVWDGDEENDYGGDSFVRFAPLN